MTKPSKPKNYWRDYFIICILALIPIPLVVYYELSPYLLPLLPILIAVVLPLFWFRSYYAALNKYAKSRQKVKKSAAHEDRKVNQNIERYVEAQKLKKQQAKWWQFWI